VSWDQFGRPTCGPCRGYAGCLTPDGCSGALLDVLLWELCGWLWLLGGRTAAETWAPEDEGHYYGEHPLESWWCDSCERWHEPAKRWLVGLDDVWCDDCYSRRQGR
jgi:hypothetical protein